MNSQLTYMIIYTTSICVILIAYVIVKGKLNHQIEINEELKEDNEELKEDNEELKEDNEELKEELSFVRHKEDSKNEFQINKIDYDQEIIALHQIISQLNKQIKNNVLKKETKAVSARSNTSRKRKPNKGS